MARLDTKDARTTTKGRRAALSRRGEHTIDHRKDSTPCLSAPTGRRAYNRRPRSLNTDDSTSAAPNARSERRARGPTGGAQLLDRRPRRIADGGHGPEARGAHPTGLVAPLEEVCLQPEAGSAICVQRFDDSLNSAIRTTYRISLRSSSLLMPRYPSTRVVYFGWSTRRARRKRSQTIQAKHSTREGWATT